MDRIWESGASASPPTAPASPSSGYPTAGNPATGTPATTPGPWWYHMVTEEMRAVIQAAGLTPDHNDLGQLLSALQALGLQDATESRKGRVELATADEVAAGTDTTRAITPAVLNNAFPSMASGNGYTRLPNGVLIQWCSINNVVMPNSGGADFSCTFPIAFNNVFHCQVNHSGYSSETGELGFGVYDVTKTGAKAKFIRLYGSNSNGSELSNLNFLAIGN